MDALKDFFKINFEKSILFAFLVGSSGTERFTENSDVDIAIYWEKEPSLNDLLGLQSHLEETLHREIDLINLNHVDYIFSRQVLETGRLIMNRAPGDFLRWQIKILSIYPDFKFSRRVIEKNILKRKKYV